jgi:hypothetical protein
MEATISLDALQEPEEPAAREAKEDATAAVWSPPDVPGTLTGALLDAGEASWPMLLRRLGAALALSAAFGVALGTRAGGLSLLRHGAGVPLGLAVVSAIVAPAFFIGLLHLGVRAEARQVAEALSRAAATSGLVLSGVAPLAALVVVSGEDAGTAAACGWLGLALGGALGLRQLAGDFDALIAAEAPPRRRSARGAALVFALVSTLLAARVWASALPVLAGGAP